jgi:signal transduction histidine kinase/phage shock protein PspC (stress-responsive transcriptional regulator)
MTSVVARPPLARPRDAVLGGVAEALARHLGHPVGSVRAVLALLVLAGGGGVLLYLWLWAFVPREPGSSTPTRATPVGILLLVLTAVPALVIVGAWQSSLALPLPAGVAEATGLLSAAAVWAVTMDARDPKHAASAPAVRLIAAGLLLVLGAALLPIGIVDGRPVVAVAAVVVLALGVTGVAVPPVLTALATRSAERATLAREEQRAEIAAHLHDSVLQTLAIIQNRAGPGSEVARIARAQERELRDWLFAGTDPFADDLATELRTIARELELVHPVRIEVVTVGDVGEIESHAVAAAAREALANAARHAGGEVTVYAEATPAAIEVFVRDRGAGFDADAIPAGRLGIRESIIGRMARAGGTAVVDSGETGTEVTLRLPRRPG